MNLQRNPRGLACLPDTSHWQPGSPGQAHPGQLGHAEATRSSPKSPQNATRLGDAMGKTFPRLSGANSKSASAQKPSDDALSNRASDGPAGHDTPYCSLDRLNLLHVAQLGVRWPRRDDGSTVSSCWSSLSGQLGPHSSRQVDDDTQTFGLGDGQRQWIVTRSGDQCLGRGIDWTQLLLEPTRSKRSVS